MQVEGMGLDYKIHDLFKGRTFQAKTHFIFQKPGETLQLLDERLRKIDIGSYEWICFILFVRQYELCSRQDRPSGVFIRRDLFSSIDDPVVITNQNQIGVFSHQFYGKQIFFFIIEFISCSYMHQQITVIVKLFDLINHAIEQIFS